ncbi:hypothetical protein HOY80DRAFT_141424 [Tuber brumale]|nr:hypothetical protein HOY80DRAFT_141424 [Tuber brumale]
MGAARASIRGRPFPSLSLRSSLILVQDGGRQARTCECTGMSHQRTLPYATGPVLCSHQTYHDVWMDGTITGTGTGNLSFCPSAGLGRLRPSFHFISSLFSLKPWQWERGKDKVGREKRKKGKKQTDIGGPLHSSTSECIFPEGGELSRGVSAQCTSRRYSTSTVPV